MASDGLCPDCGGMLHPIYIGEQHDKLLQCDHCEYQIDVPDEGTGDEGSVDFYAKTIFDAAVTRNQQMGIPEIRAGSREDAITKVRAKSGEERSSPMETTVQSVQTSQMNFRHQRTKVAGIEGQIDEEKPQAAPKRAGSASGLWMFVGAAIGIALCAMIATLILVAMMFQ